MSLPNPGARSARFAAVLCELDRLLDWPLLGGVYCHEGGSDFFNEEALVRLRDSGLELASDVVTALVEKEALTNRSCYVGAGVFELAPILAEVLLLGREVDVYSLPGPEPDELNRALAAVESSAGTRLPRLRTERFAPAAKTRYSHAWLVSVLTDPEHFPALHDTLYERTGSELATGRGNLDEEQMRARSLVRRLLQSLTPEALFTTTDEELLILAPACRRERLHLQVPSRFRLSGIVEDPVRVCAIARDSAQRRREERAK